MRATVAAAARLNVPVAGRMLAKPALLGTTPGRTRAERHAHRRVLNARAVAAGLLVLSPRAVVANRAGPKIAGRSHLVSLADGGGGRRGRRISEKAISSFRSTLPW